MVGLHAVLIRYFYFLGFEGRNMSSIRTGVRGRKEAKINLRLSCLVAETTKNVP